MTQLIILTAIVAVTYLTAVVVGKSLIRLFFPS